MSRATGRKVADVEQMFYNQDHTLTQGKKTDLKQPVKGA